LIIYNHLSVSGDAVTKIFNSVTPTTHDMYVISNRLFPLVILGGLSATER